MDAYIQVEVEKLARGQAQMLEEGKGTDALVEDFFQAINFLIDDCEFAGDSQGKHYLEQVRQAAYAWRAEKPNSWGIFVSKFCDNVITSDIPELPFEDNIIDDVKSGKYLKGETIG